MIKIRESVSDIEELIAEACAKELDSAIKPALFLIQERVRRSMLGYWKSSPTYNSLLYGDLNSKLGFYAGTANTVVDQILDIIAESTQVVFEGTKLYKRTFRCTFNIYILLNNLKSALASPGAIIDTEKGFQLEWFKWLSVFGDRILIDSYRYFPKIGKGRSGGGIMIKGGAFRIPSFHSGTIGDNWLTRAIEPFVNDIRDNCFQIIDDEVSKHIS